LYLSIRSNWFENLFEAQIRVRVEDEEANRLPPGVRSGCATGEPTPNTVVDADHVATHFSLGGLLCACAELIGMNVAPSASAEVAAAVFGTVRRITVIRIPIG